ncbi:MAG: Calx-beta domain-containing protein, partial [Candidatus Gracilibacteria bacterium]|nr:Calx-beta domain-containing protein [Candidatus Gracilibacteria bacterium]
MKSLLSSLARKSLSIALAFSLIISTTSFPSSTFAAGDVFIDLSQSAAATNAGFDSNDLEWTLYQGATLISRNLNPTNGVPDGSYELEFTYNGGTLDASGFRIDPNGLSNATLNSSDPERVDFSVSGGNITVGVLFDVNTANIFFDLSATPEALATNLDFNNVDLGIYEGSNLLAFNLNPALLMPTRALELEFLYNGNTLESAGYRIDTTLLTFLDSNNTPLTITPHATNPDRVLITPVSGNVTVSVTLDLSLPEIDFVSAASSGDEGTSPAQIDLQLSKTFPRTVTVEVSTTDQTATAGVDYSALSGQTVTFSPNTTTQTVNLTVSNDQVDEDNETLLLSLSNFSDGVIGTTNPTHTFTINDNDIASIIVTPTSGLTTTENGGTATFTMALGTLPTSNVTINLNTSDPTEGSVSPTSLTFTPVNALTAQTVTVTGQDDLIQDGSVQYSIVTQAASSTDQKYNSLDGDNVDLSNSDNDTAGITVTPTTGLVTTENGGTATFTVVLNSLPTANVSISLSSSNAGEGTVNPSSLTFTSINGLTPQTITVTGVNDFVIDGPVQYTVITNAASSTDGNYNGLDSENVEVTNTDNDIAGIVVNPTSGLTTTEAGGTATFMVNLDTDPSDNVVIDLSSSNPGEGIPSPTILTFTPSNARTPQTVTITGIDDANADGPVNYSIITAPAVSNDSNYDTLNASDVTATNTDDETAGIIVTPSAGLSTTEAGGTAQFTVVLTSLPADNVTISLASSNTGEGTVSPSALTFTSANGMTAQTVTVTGVDDQIEDGDIAYQIVTGVAISTDSDYNGQNPSDVTVTNTDNDTAGITITPTSGLITTEAGGTTTFTFVLNTMPTDDVTFMLSSSDTTEGTVSPSSLTFTSANGTTVQTVTVTGVDDLIQDGDISYNIITAAAVSTDTAYNGQNPSDVSVTNTDDDTAGITVTPTTGLTTTEAGGTTTFTVVLDSPPTADVTISLGSDDTTEGTISPSSLTFTSANGTTAQTITITGVDDAIVDGNIIYNIVIDAAISADTNYNGLDPSNVAVSNTDNDSGPGIIVNPTTGLISTEAGGTATFTVAMSTLPTADVTIALSSSDTTEGTVSPANLTFTSLNGTTAQTVTITGVDDALVDGNVAYSIVTAAAISADLNYNGINPSDVSVTNSDNDSTSGTGTITVTPTSGLVTNEGGTSATFTIVLNQQPTFGVIINLSSNDTTEGT